MPLSARLVVLVAAVAVGGCGEQHQIARPPAPQVPEEAVSDAYALVDVPRLNHAPPVRPLPAVRPRPRRHVVRRAPARHVRVRVVPRAAPAAVPIPVQRPLARRQPQQPRPRSRPAAPPIVFDDSG